MSIKLPAKNYISILVSLFLIFSPLHGQTNQGAILHTTDSDLVEVRIVSVNKNTLNNQLQERTAIQYQKIKYTMTLANGRFIRGSVFEFINGDSLVLIANDYEYVASLKDIEKISEIGNNKIKKGALFGAAFGLGYILLLVILEGAGEDEEYDLLGPTVGFMGIGTTIGGITGAILNRKKNHDMTGWSIDKKRATIQKMIDNEK